MARGFSLLPIPSLYLLRLALSIKSLKEVEDWSEWRLDMIWVSSEAASGRAHGWEALRILVWVHTCFRVESDCVHPNIWALLCCGREEDVATVPDSGDGHRAIIV